MAQVIKSTHLTVIGLSNNESSALASLLFNLDSIASLKLLAPNHIADLAQIRKDTYGY